MNSGIDGKGVRKVVTAKAKWIAVRRNLQDDIVIVMAENLPRNRWKLARVQEAFPSDDGLVRKVKMAIATESFEDSGRPTKPIVYLERPTLLVVQEESSCQ